MRVHIVFLMPAKEMGVDVCHAHRVIDLSHIVFKNVCRFSRDGRLEYNDNPPIQGRLVLWEYMALFYVKVSVFTLEGKLSMIMQWAM